MDLECLSVEPSKGQDDWTLSRVQHTIQGKGHKRHTNGRSQQPTLTIHVRIRYHVDASKPLSRKRMRSKIIKKFKKKFKTHDQTHDHTESELQNLLDETPTEIDHDMIHAHYDSSNPSIHTDIDNHPSARVHQMPHSRPYVSAKLEVFDPERILGIWYDFKPRTNLSSTNLDEPTFQALQTNLAAEVAHSTDVLIRISDLYERLPSKVRAAIEHHLSNFSKDITAVSTTQGTTQVITGDQQYYEPISANHRFLCKIDVIESWLEGNFATITSILSYYRDVLNWLLYLTPELAYAKIRSNILCTIYPEAPQDCLTFPGIMELCCNYLLEACQ